ncbi:MAG TPA: hypothetical protein VGP57_15565, partial [Actinoplanes sp.]|nr:hypothetical protein [Actinoplanes sp.]
GLFAGVIPISAVATTMVLGLRSPGIGELAGALLVGCGVVAGLNGSASRPLAVDVPQHEDEQHHDECSHPQRPHDGKNPVDRAVVAEQAAQDDTFLS